MAIKKSTIISTFGLQNKKTAKMLRESGWKGARAQRSDKGKKRK